MTHSYFAPDWVMLGVAGDDGSVYIYASSDMTQAELEAVRDEPDLFDPYDASRTFRQDLRIILRAEMKTVTVVRGETYAQALRILLQGWTPPEPARPAISEAPKALGYDGGQADG